MCAAEDRAERRRKLGLPEHLTPEEEARERAKQADKEAAQRKKPLVAAPKPVTNLESMRQSLVDMKKQCAGDDARAKVAFETLMKYIGNIYQVRPLPGGWGRCLSLRDGSRGRPVARGRGGGGPLNTLGC